VYIIALDILIFFKLNTSEILFDSKREIKFYYSIFTERQDCYLLKEKHNAVMVYPST